MYILYIFIFMYINNLTLHFFCPRYYTGDPLSDGGRPDEDAVVSMIVAQIEMEAALQEEYDKIVRYSSSSSSSSSVCMCVCVCV